jgi:hypothetical protein
MLLITVDPQKTLDVLTIALQQITLSSLDILCLTNSTCNEHYTRVTVASSFSRRNNVHKVIKIFIMCHCNNNNYASRPGSPNIWTLA